MIARRLVFGAAALGAAALAAACSGTVGAPNNTPAGPTPAPIVTLTPTTQQVISIAIPTSAIGTTKDAAGAVIGGYTQSQFSQILGFAPGSKVMLRNAQTSTIPHTLGDTGGTAAFPGAPNLTLTSNTANGGTFKAGFQSGTIAAGALAGPFTLQAGTYFIGCAYHYLSDNMRDILVVAANATPGPQATQAPSAPTPAPTGGGFRY